MKYLKGHGEEGNIFHSSELYPVRLQAQYWERPSKFQTPAKERVTLGLLGPQSLEDAHGNQEMSLWAVLLE